MWSFGCILAELYTGFPIFPAETEGELVCKIVEIFGEPPCEVLRQGTRSGLFFEGGGKLRSEVVNGRSLKKSAGLSSVMKGADLELLLIIEGCLQWDPRKRLTPEAAVLSPWFDEYSKSRDVRRKCKISMEDITKHTPQLKKFIAHRNKTLSLAGVSN